MTYAVSKSIALSVGISLALATVGLGPSATASVSSVTAKAAVAAASPYQSPTNGGTLTNLMDLIFVAGDDTFAVSGAQSVVSIRLDSAPMDDTGTGFVAIQLSANTAAPTTGTGYGRSATGTTTSVAVVAPSNYLWATGSVVQLSNLDPTTRVVALQGVAPKAGTYGFTAWVNDGVGSNTVLDPDEPYTTGNLIVGGEVASFVIAPPTRVAGTSQAATFAVSAKDSAGRVTFPTGDDTGGPWGSWTTTPASGVSVQAAGVTTSDGTAKLTSAAFLNPTYTRIQGVATVTVTATNIGTYAIQVGPGGSMPGTVTVANATLNALSSATLASAISSGPVANSSNGTTYTPQASITASGAAVGNVFLATTEPTVSFLMTATPAAVEGQILTYAVIEGSSGSEAGVTEGPFSVPVNPNKTATIDVTATDAQAGDFYYVVLGQGANRITYTVTYGSPILSITNLKTTPGLGTTSFAQTASAVPIAASVTDQYGQKLPNVTVTAVPSLSTSVTATTDDSGVARLTIPAAGTATTQTVNFRLTPPLGSPTGFAASPLTIIYNASGAPAGLTVASSAGSVAATAGITQNVDVSGATASTWSGNGNAGWMAVTATVAGGTMNVPVTFSAKDTYFAPSNANLLSSSSTNAEAIVVNTAAGGTATAYAKATKTGTVTVKVSAGALSTDITWKVANAASDARTLVVTPVSQEATGLAQVTATVTDVFGNPVGSAPLTFSESGVGNFASGASTLSATTGPTGAVTVDVLSTQSGDATVTVLGGSSGQWVASAGTPFTASPAAINSGTASIAFTSRSSKSITITGERSTVSGKPGIKVDGATTGLASGGVVKPWVKFPGQSTYESGSARPPIDSAGNFTWERKTGKKIYVYFSDDTGKIRSNRIVIAAQ